VNCGTAFSEFREQNSNEKCIRAGPHLADKPPAGSLSAISFHLTALFP